MPKTHKEVVYDIDIVMNKFRQSIENNLVYKKQQNMLDWLNTFSDYLANEQNFDPLTDTLKYNAGAILCVDLGFNPKSEHGGRHYAVVVEDNDKKSNTVMIVPLGSQKTGTKVNWNDVDLGIIEEINKLKGEEGVKSIAKISNMCSISKMRIVQPVNANKKIIYLDSDKLKLIYDKIRQRFTTKGLNRKQNKRNITQK
ncbi:type II toxin-antitoxin system PemK/MazF family toxin [Caldibacillus thermoamylovorans]|uniref:type II toxin-antitoxin system PemK/MazF family toxin n=1 Tax=Caldibacillus thermoamylovorans TaxID=35841 RepID=UPI00203EEDD2|nr:type II toxin-antitoxin system PemK/MazF family toxin [Caldibacillus thermoamylovorans]MCM3800030.1 type II toxin-antitoxin system PemK/MazF family toxin [Caldibacillus thermoamylovorans]